MWQDAIHLETMISPLYTHIGAGVGHAGDWVYYTIVVGYLAGSAGSGATTENDTAPTAVPGTPAPTELLSLGQEITDANAAFFDAANNYAGCIAGIHQVLKTQGLLAGTWCLNPKEGLSAGQLEEIQRVIASYPHLNDNDFVERNLESWLED